MRRVHILIVTPYFPAPDVFRERSEDPRTKYLYDYAMEWQSQGHQVGVLHYPRKYPVAFPLFAHFVENVLGIRRFRLDRYVQSPAALTCAAFESHGIRIVRSPVTKLLPHRDFSARRLKKLAAAAKRTINEERWKVDVIVSDFFSPSLFVSRALGEQLNVPFFQTFNEVDLHYLRRHRRQMLPPLAKAGGILFRSNAMIRQCVEEGLAPNAPHHIMYSGFPPSVAMGGPRQSVGRLLYVGSLIPRKRVDVLLRAFAAAGLGPNVLLEIAGSGPCERELRNQVAALKMNDRVHFLGQLRHDEVFEAMRAADVFVMVSVDTFGMVYVEAMSQGCIAVAAKGQGMDGLIVDGQNGLLVELDNVEALSEALRRLRMLEGVEIERLSGNGLRTVRNLKNDVLARDLLGDVLARHLRVE